ncbi:hypothetical protein ES703_117498 [subsurface metagenome]
MKKFSEKDWHNRDFRRNLFNGILTDNTTPENIRKFNQIIARSFGKVAALENVGLRPFTDTNPRCGNCNFICVADPKKRKELYNMLINSGKVYIDKEGKEFVKKFDKDWHNRDLIRMEMKLHIIHQPRNNFLPRKNLLK